MYSNNQKETSYTGTSSENLLFQFFKKQKFLNMTTSASILFYITCFFIGVSLYVLYPGNISYISNSRVYNPTGFHEHVQPQQQIISAVAQKEVFENISNVQPQQNISTALYDSQAEVHNIPESKSDNDDHKSCDLFKGRWIPDARDPLYTNYTCTTMQVYKNCFLHGRSDRDFLHWRWKPDECELPRFNPQEFLTTLQGKTVAFIGDSVARNNMESLLCLLSSAETPIQIYKDAEDRFATWQFPAHEFTLRVYWSPFLVNSSERVINGYNANVFDVHLDKVDNDWFQELPSIDYAIFSTGHWFSKPSYLHEGGNILACTYCDAPNVTNLGPGPGIGKVLRAVFKEINNCENCKKVRIFLRTFSPQHFEGGAWNEGGRCNRTTPYTKEEVANWSQMELRNTQVEEFGIARNGSDGNENMFKMIDVTEMMLMRADGHPDEFYGGNWNKGYRDCVHWCLPGPVDTWNELLFELIRTSII